MFWKPLGHCHCQVAAGRRRSCFHTRVWSHSEAAPFSVFFLPFTPWRPLPDRCSVAQRRSWHGPLTQLPAPTPLFPLVPSCVSVPTKLQMLHRPPGLCHRGSGEMRVGHLTPLRACPWFWAALLKGCRFWIPLPLEKGQALHLVPAGLLGPGLHSCFCPLAEPGTQLPSVLVRNLHEALGAGGFLNTCRSLLLTNAPAHAARKSFRCPTVTGSNAVLFSPVFSCRLAAGRTRPPALSLCNPFPPLPWAHAEEGRAA